MTTMSRRGGERTMALLREIEAAGNLTIADLDKPSKISCTRLAQGGYVVLEGGVLTLTEAGKARAAAGNGRPKSKPSKPKPTPPKSRGVERNSIPEQIRAVSVPVKAIPASDGTWRDVAHHLLQCVERLAKEVQ